MLAVEPLLGLAAPAMRSLLSQSMMQLPDMREMHDVRSICLSLNSHVDSALAQVNPWMRPEVEMIVAQDSSVTGMYNWCANPNRAWYMKGCIMQEASHCISQLAAMCRHVAYIHVVFERTTCSSPSCERQMIVPMLTMQFRSGFFFVRPVPSVMAFFQIWLGAAYNAKDPLDVWDQGVYNETLLLNPTGIRCAAGASEHHGAVCQPTTSRRPMRRTPHAPEGTSVFAAEWSQDDRRLHCMQLKRVSHRGNGVPHARGCINIYIFNHVHHTPTHTHTHTKKTESALDRRYGR